MTELDRQIEYWDRVADEKSFTHPLDVPLLKQFVPFESRVLDYGCGYGRIVEEIRGIGYAKAIGTDISAAMIERGRREYPALDLREVRGSRLPFEDDAFDLVLLFAVLTCIASDEGQEEVIGEIERVLSPGGFIYVSDYPLQEDEKNLGRYGAFEQKYGRYGVFELPEGAVVRHHDPAWIESLLSRFQKLSYKEIPVTTMNGSTAKGFQFLGKR